MISMSDEFAEALALSARDVEGRLDALLTDIPQDDEIARPAHLLNAMRHAVLNGGKRLRPFLVMESTRLHTGDRALLAASIDVAAAIECVHCYSLVHDDLPAMDDDNLRRGKPTVHIAFDEATAILAGDALQTLAFDIIAALDIDAARRVALIGALARASGIGGMAGGQSLDLQAERSPPDETGIITMQAMKTGALIRVSCEAGAILGGAGPDERQRLRQYGETIGLAFQLADDLLDLNADADIMGKATGKDAARNKATLAALHGTGWARRQLDGLVVEAAALLEPYELRARTLVEAARFVAARRR